MNPDVKPGQRIAVVSGPIILTVAEVDDETGAFSGHAPDGTRYTVGPRNSPYVHVALIETAPIPTLEPDWPADPIPDTPDTQATEVTT